LSTTAARRGPPVGITSRIRAPTFVTCSRIAAALVGGLFLCASFPPVGVWPAAILGFALLGWALADRSTTPVGGAGLGFVFGLSFYLPLLPWTGIFVGALPWMALSTVCALFPALFGFVAVTLRPLPGWPIWWASSWVTIEWLKSSVPFGGFPWGLVGFGQADGPLAPYARFGGVTLVSFVVVLAGFSVFVLCNAIARRSIPLGAGVVVQSVVGLLVVGVGAIGSGALVAERDRPDTSTGLTVAAVQGNVPRLGLDFNAQRRAVLANHVEMTMRLAGDVAAGLVDQPDLVIWPENSSDVDPFADATAAAQISSAARAVAAPIMVGAVVADPTGMPTAPTTTNSVIVWSPDSGPGQRHDKKILQPFGEYLPWRDFFRLFSAYADRAGNFVPGDGAGVVQAADVTVGVATCWEVVFDRAPRDAVRNGAQVLVVPSNNATFNETMSRQQLAFAKIRAIEHDRPVLVAATTGISAIVRPDGSVTKETRFFQGAYLVDVVTPKSTSAPATRWAPSIQVLLLAVTIGAIAAAAVKARVGRNVSAGWWRP
jgi:apolipoprotein N-acyltransferase